jgi:preprotein translocase subunit SecA
VLEHRWVTRAIETAQRKVEAHNFDIRKNLLEYDDVANEQRKVVYELRDELMASASVSPLIEEVRRDVVTALIDAYIPPQTLEELWNAAGLEEASQRDFGLELPVQQWLKDDKALDEKGLRERLQEAVGKAYEDKREKYGAELMQHIEKSIMLQALDRFWREHLASTDYLRQGIHLRGYAQKDPKQEFKREAFIMFNDMLARFKHEVISVLARVEVQSEAEVAAIEEEERRRAQQRAMHFEHAEASAAMADAAPTEDDPDGDGGMAVEARSGRTLQAAAAGAAARTEPFVREVPKVGRNEPCPCGSGKKYKQCHGRLA